MNLFPIVSPDRAAMGDKLVKRLHDKAGLTFEVEA